MARIIASSPPRNTVRFITFAAEEVGCLGSTHYASSADSADMDIGLMLNNDVMGYINNSGEIQVYRYPGCEAYSDLLGQATIIYTPLIPQYLTGYFSSDDYPFYARGYPATRGKEYPYSPYWHTLGDTLGNISIPYCAKLTMAGLATIAILANYPKKVSGLVVSDIGNGFQLYVQWQPNLASNVAGYWIRWGKSSGNYTDSMQVTGTGDIIGGLTADSLYYVGLSAVDADGNESPVITEAIGTPKAFPLIPSGLAAAPVDSGLRLSWDKNLELDLAGYDVYRRVDGSSFDSLTSTADTFLLDQPLSGASRYYYKLKARDADGNYSPLSDSAYGRPITLDQGILVVDETNNWTTTSFPRDAQQDSFYNYLTAGYKTEGYDFGIAVQKPVLADLGPYSTVLWHTDDPSTFLAYNDSGAMREYKDHGGKIWFTGWKPTGNIRNSATYPASFTAGNLLYDNFGISYVELSGSTDSLMGVQGLSGYPAIAVDPAKYPASTLYGGTMRNIEALTPRAGFDTIYVMDMKNNESPYEGRACAVRDSGKVVLFGFPLYYMDKDQARLAAQKVLEEFGEPLGVAGKPEIREQITNVRLFQNSPNPFRQQTNIKYQMPKAGPVKLQVYNIAGQLVRTLVNGEQQSGSYTIKWDRHDNNDRLVSAGVYIYHLSAGDKTQSRKMIVLK